MNYKLYQHIVSNCKVRKFLRMTMLINPKKRLKESYKKCANYFGGFKTMDKER
jgi:hypothetical protein